MLIDEALAILGIERPMRPRNKIECPNHSERIPSLHLYEDDFYCFSCAANGDGYGLVALIQGRPVAEVLKEYGDGNFETARTMRASRADQVRGLRAEWHDWLHGYVLQLDEALDDIIAYRASQKKADIFAPVDEMMALLPHRSEWTPAQVEAYHRKAIDHLEDRLKVEQGLKELRNPNIPVSHVAQHGVQGSRLQPAVPQARRPSGSGVRAGGAPRQFGSVRVAQATSLDEGDERRASPLPRLLHLSGLSS